MKTWRVSQAGLCGLAALCMVALTARAAFITDWSAGDVASLADAVDNGLAHPSMDITNLLYRFSGATHYFRMDLRGVPEIGANNSAPDYMIQIDSAAGGASYGTAGNVDFTQSTYPAAGLSGIDQIVDTNFRLFGGYGSDYHAYQAGISPYINFTTNVTLASVGGVFNVTTNASVAIFEWSVPTTVLQAQPFTFWGATRYIDGPNTWDLSGPMTGGPAALVPEPGTFALMAVVLAAGALFLRRRQV